MAREKSDIEYQVVTVRFPKEIYQEYKKILKSEGKIPTYDLRNYIFSVVDEYVERAKIGAKGSVAKFKNQIQGL